ncbi:hypothetical protein AB6A40_007198 [Gnathostoma spinigerum]|uniref:Uncharacterized protein n=1 Tax=Gnathostoma spinigerum TaxID=75299 RepID=A0ABD6EKK1_9BILA
MEALDCHSSISFRYHWITRTILRQLSNNETAVLQVSPKFATVHEHVAFQWSLKLNGSTCLTSDGDDGDEQKQSDYIAVCLYFYDGPLANVTLRSVVCSIVEKKNDHTDLNAVSLKREDIRMVRGDQTELEVSGRRVISDYIKAHVGRTLRLSLVIEADRALFDPNTYLKYKTPTPFNSFLTTNYRARAASRVWRKRSKRQREVIGLSKSSSATNLETKPKEPDYEALFNKVMDEEREKRQRICECNDNTSETEQENPTEKALSKRRCSGAVPNSEHIFKKLLVACCETCERRASLFDSIDPSSDDDNDDGKSDEDSGDENAFECAEESKERIHDILANMYFNKVILPEMEYVEDFADFLIDAELNDLPVLKRACERYLCGELISKRDLLTSLLLDLLFLSVVFHLPLLKSLTISELSDRPDELASPEKLLEQKEYQSINSRMRGLCDLSLVELINEVKMFREQRLRAPLIQQ